MHNNPLWKTRWCDFNWRSHGCRKGGDCRHAHSIYDYRGSHDDPWWRWYHARWIESTAKWIYYTVDDDVQVTADEEHTEDAEVQENADPDMTLEQPHTEDEDADVIGNADQEKYTEDEESRSDREPLTPPGLRDKIYAEGGIDHETHAIIAYREAYHKDLPGLAVLQPEPPASSDDFNIWFDEALNNICDPELRELLGITNL